MIIGITGYGCTGASAVIDLLQEFEGVQSYPSSIEFQLLQQPDGILDLKYHLVDSGRRLSNNVAIKRYCKSIKSPSTAAIRKFTNGRYEELSNAYIQQLIQIQWRGKSAFDPKDVRYFFDTLSLKPLNKIIDRVLFLTCKRFNWPPKSTRYFSMMEEESFDKITKNYFENILKASNFDLSKPIILEQLFNTSEPLAGSEYIEDPISIIVDRDPRDVYLLMNHYYSRFTSFMPDSGDVDQFITYYKNLHKAKSNDPRVLYIQFEDLIFEYDKICKQLEEALDGYKHQRKAELFKPACSYNNTMLYKKFPQYKKEIQKIEEELAEYLYPFEEKRLPFEPEDVGIFNRQSDVGKKIRNI